MKIYNLIILDKSGSMDCIRQQAINGCNESFDTIRKSQNDFVGQQVHLATLVTFNGHKIDTLFENRPIADVLPLARREYMPNGSTPLYDAIGFTLTALREELKDQDSKEYSVLVTIITDGYENSSREYRLSTVKALIEELSDEGWLFSYIGADHDVEKVATTLSIENVLRFEKTNAGVNEMWENDSLSRMNFYCSLSEVKWEEDEVKRRAQRRELNRTYFDKIREEQQEKKKSE